MLQGREVFYTRCFFRKGKRFERFFGSSKVKISCFSQLVRNVKYFETVKMNVDDKVSERQKVNDDDKVNDKTG